GFLNDALISNKANLFPAELKLDKFKNSDGYLHKFKKRHGFRMTKLHGEMRTNDPVDVDLFIEKFIEISKGYNADQIYNLDETGLYYKLIPSKSICRNRFQGYKNFKDRVSIMLCSNMSGNHKLKPVMISKPKMPRCFKSYDYKCFIDYYSSERAWMTGTIFTNWLLNFDYHLKNEKKQILLLMDNCPSHCVPSNLDNIKILFFPPNSTGLIQPMDLGIIKTFKTHFTRHKLMYLTDLLEQQNISVYSSYKKLTLKDTVIFLKMACEDVSEKTIANCFGILSNPFKRIM
ncbi:tigger transposable element-derived protein 6-like, partial [Octopus sinensis]|uniref:Tigger transposable element-derived protein 6-like n=1 Tax=Octopus sinensis TaxID=2607531 RepID=A0A6P7U3V3_9MOLL